MTIDWQSLALVGFTTVAVTVSIVGIVATGVLALTAPAGADGTGSRWWTRALGWGCGVLAGLLVVFGLYLIVPAFH